jgi:hypothetical protein
VDVAYAQIDKVKRDASQDFKSKGSKKGGQKGAKKN